MTELALEIPKILMQELISWGLKEAFSFSRIRYLIKTLEKKKRILEAWLLDADATQLPEGPGREAFEQLISELENLHDSLDLAAARAMRRQLTSRSRTAKKVLLFFSSSNPIICAFREAREVKALQEELDRIATSHNQLVSLLKLSCDPMSQKKAPGLIRRPFTSQVVIGRDKDRDNIIRMLLESSSAQETFYVVCIVGIGGMGKTTLAQYVFSDGRVKSHFDLMIWVCVPQSLTVEDMMKNMVAFATDETHLQGGMHQLAFAIDETHLQGVMRQVAFATDRAPLQLQCHFQGQITDKKFLLVLDNVWNHELLSRTWQDLVDLIGVGAPGSMVLTTTRSVGVAKTMGVIKPYMLMDLAKEDSWHLFKRIAFTPGQDPRVDAIGREIVQMCPNVPLVICNIGHHLKGKCDISQWVDFKDRLSHLRSCREAPNVMEILKLSYDELDPKLKLCFAYCSLFPEYYLFSEDSFIHHWIALGYVESQSENQNLVDIARDYVRRLKDQGFFNSYDNRRFQMHDVIHDLAVWVAGPTYKRVDSWEGLEFEDDRIRHLWIKGDEGGPPMDLQYSRLIKMTKQLQSLILNGGRYIRPLKLSLPHFECLRVLSISDLGLNEMPRIISKLITLRYLDLSRNNFRKLPDSVTQLVNLTYLNLSYCTELQELPSGLSKLQNLLQLNLSDCSKLQKLPTDMTSLLSLTLSYCVRLQELPRGLSKLRNLLELRLGGCSNLQKLPPDMSKFTELRTLNLDFCENLQELPRDMSKLVKLRELRLFGCFQLRHMPVGLGNCTGLQTLSLFAAEGRSLSRTNPSDCDDCEVGALADLGRLNNLEGELTIKVDGEWSSESEARAANLQGKQKLKELKIEFVGGSSGDNEMLLEGFQPNANLRELWIRGYRGERIPSWMDDNHYFSNLEGIHIFNWGTCVCFGSFGRLPRLERLEIANLSNLEYVESTTTDPSALSAAVLFPRLEVLALRCLPKLKGWRTMCASSSSGAGPIIFPMLRWLFLDRVGLEIVPEEFQGLSSLRHLRIQDCNLLKGIPEWIETLVSLERILIYKCPQVTSSPEQMVKLSNFHFKTQRRFGGEEGYWGERRGNGSTSS